MGISPKIFDGKLETSQLDRVSFRQFVVMLNIDLIVLLALLLVWLLGRLQISNNNKHVVPIKFLVALSIVCIQLIDLLG